MKDKEDDFDSVSSKSFLFSKDSNTFIKTALKIFSQNEETSTLNALTELSLELSMANDSVKHDPNFHELIKQLIILLNKFLILPDISLLSLTCINYILDINPKASNTFYEYGGVKQIIQLTQNIDFIDCIELAIKVIEKMSYEIVSYLIRKNAFVNILTFLDFFDLNLRKIVLKACLNMVKYDNTLDDIILFFIPGIPALTSLTKLSGNSELEKSILTLAVQCFYYLILGVKRNSYSKELNWLCNEICKYGLLDNLYELFQGFINVEDSNMNDNLAKVNINIETIKQVLKIFQLLSSLSDEVINYLLQHNSLVLIYTVLNRELLIYQPSELQNNDNNENKKSKLNSNSQSLYSDIFNLLMSFFPAQSLDVKNSLDNKHFTKIMSIENKEYYLYFGANILKLLIDNIVYIPSNHTSLWGIQLITMYCSNSPNENIIKYITTIELSNTISKMLDSKDSSYIFVALLLLDILMRKIPHHFFNDFIRQGVVDNVKKLTKINKQDLCITKEINYSTFKNSFYLINNKSINESNELTKKKTDVLNSTTTTDIINLSANLIEEIYFSELNINLLLSQTKCAEGKLNPFQIMDKLNEFKEKLKQGEQLIHSEQERINLFKQIINILIKCKVTFHELEKSDIIFTLCSYLDKNFAINHSNTNETDINTMTVVSNQYDNNIANKVIALYQAFNNDQEQIISFLKILQQCISSMNCFKLCLDEYDNIKGVFLSAFRGSDRTYSSYKLNMIYCPNESSRNLKDHSNKMGDNIKNIIKFYDKEKKGIIINVNLEKTFEELKETIMTYPMESEDISDDDSDDYLRNFFKVFIHNEDNDIPKEISKRILERKHKFELARKRFRRKKEEKQSNNEMEIDEEDNKEQKKRETFDNINSFLKEYDIKFWIDLPNKTKYEIPSNSNIHSFIKTRKQMINISMKLSMFNIQINFAFVKRNPPTLISNTQNEYNSNKCTSITDYNKDLQCQLFEYFYNKTIVNNEDTYNIKRASPFLYLITLIELSHNYFSTYFNLTPIPLSLFENLKMTGLLFKQIRDPNSICSDFIPSWCKQVNSSFPFLTNFSSRHLLFKTTSFEKRRSMTNLYVYLKNFLGENILEDKLINSLSSNFNRLKLKVNRNNIIEDAYSISNKFIRYKDYIEYEYYNETGTGMGPTLEFYSLFCKAISNEKKLWYKTEDYSLFPMPVIGCSHDEIQFIKKCFEALGFVIARALYDDRLIDIPLNSLFWDLILNRPVTFDSIFKVDKYIAKFIHEHLGYINTNKYPNYDDIDLYFEVPWNNEQPLIPNGSEIKVNAKNINQYISEIFNKLLIEGQTIVIDAFKEGFNKVFDIDNLKCFSSNELVDIICGSSVLNNSFWTYEHLVQNIIPSHGFNKESLVYEGLIEILMKMTNEERKMFLLFVTGSPRLPIGGFKNLYPKLTVVMFQSEYNENTMNFGNFNPDKHLPSVMTCQNYLKIPNYSNISILKEKLFFAIKEGNNAFHLS